jgi:YgiT-type zinc finger domain-containing protein
MEQHIGVEKERKMQNQFKNDDLCPICEIGTLNEQVVDDDVNILGTIYSLKNMRFFHCDVCVDGFYDEETMQRLDELVKRHRRNNNV